MSDGRTRLITKAALPDAKSRQEYVIAATRTATDQHAPLRAIGAAIQAHGVKPLADGLGIDRGSLYDTFMTDCGDPKWSTLCKVLGALGLRLVVERVENGGACSGRADGGENRPGFCPLQAAE